jgi:hypothetical protein
MLLSTGALQAQDKPELEIGVRYDSIIIYPLGEGQKNAEVILDMMSSYQCKSQYKGIN